MRNLKNLRSETLENTHERACAKLARIAKSDTIWGGFRANMIAKRATLKKFPAEQIVGDVYSASTGKHSLIWEAWECPECGKACLGEEAAINCCQKDY